MFQGCEKHLLPSLVHRASAEASSLIRLLSNLLSVPVSVSAVWLQRDVTSDRDKGMSILRACHSDSIKNIRVCQIEIFQDS